jgi:hypothetical protein
MGNDADAAATADYDTDMQTIGNYVSAVVEAKAKIVTAYTAALDNAQMTFQTASPAEARPDILGVMLKSGLESAEKAAVTAVKEATGADLGPLVDMMNAISDEVDRAAKAAADRAVADWLTALRTSLVNAYTQGQTGEDLRQQIEGEYKNNDVGGRGGYIAGIENELTALGTVQAPAEEVIEVNMYQSWINQNFNGDCMDGTGMIQLQFAADGSATSATVTAPLGDRVAGRLNSILANAKVWRLMDLDVVKKVCRDTDCMCFEGNNTVRKDVLDGDTHTFLTSPDNWKLFTSFTT